MFTINNDKLQSKLITHENPKAPSSEAFRALRTSLHFASIEHDYKTILFTSAGMEEGKTTVLANTAIALAQSGKKILIVDTDLRRPSQHKIFDIPNVKGITDILADEIEPLSVIQKTNVPNVDLITSGLIPPNPSELLASKRMEKFIAYIKNKYDIVFFDTPPVIAVTDAILLSAKVEGVIMVIRASVTKINMVKEAREKLTQANAQVIGMVLNDVNMETEDYQYYYYYGHGREKVGKTKKLLNFKFTWK